MSNIPKARKLIEQVLPYITDRKIKRTLARALSLMTRAKYIRHAHPVAQVITPAMKRKARKLNHNLNLTQVDIARIVGLRNQARVSEILNGKR